MNDAVYKFKRYEDATLKYIGINKHTGEDFGLYDTVLSKKDYEEIFVNERYLCKQNKVKSLYVFGSVLTENFNDTSDIDLVVDIDSNDPFEYADSYFNLKFALQDLLKRTIDLLENKAIRNPVIRNNIDSSKYLIYVK